MENIDAMLLSDYRMHLVESVLKCHNDFPIKGNYDT